MIAYDGKRWIALLFRIRGSVVPALAGRTAIAGALGALAAWLHHEHGFHIPSTAHTILGVALGLLLVFRTNSSYDRFWEGRKLLGMMVNRARDLMRQGLSYIEGDPEGARRHHLALQRRIVVLYALIRQFLRGERDLDKLGASLTAEERAQLEPVQVRPAVAFT